MAGPWAEASLTSSQFFSRLPGTQGEDTSDNLWADLLKEVAANKHKTLPSRSLLVLGDRDSGKTTLLAKLQGNEDPKKGSGLEFGYIDVRDEEEGEEHTLLNHYILDGDVAHSNLLQFALTEENMECTTVLICTSMSTPWSVMDQLHKWISVLQDRVDQLHLSADQVMELRSAKQARWETYSEPGCDFPSSPRRYTPTTQFPLSDLSPCESQPPSITGLEEGVLSRNLGMDLVIVLTKSDAMVQLEAEQGFTDQHFDFLQQAVRRFCLTYGASLFYSSVKEDKNCDLLYKYLVHTSYGFPLTTPALVVERDALFIPAGWDTHTKISILYENLFKFSPDQSFGDVIKSPFSNKGNKPSSSKTVEVVAEAEQDFLARLAPFLIQDGGLPSSSPLSSHLHHSPESVLKTPERRLAGSPGVHSALKRSEFGAGKTPNDGAISNFFHALLQKKTGSTTHLPVVEPADILSEKVEGQTKLNEDIGTTHINKQIGTCHGGEIRN